MKYVIAIPSGGGDRLKICLESIDPEIRANVLVYKNAPGINEMNDVLGYGGTGVNDGVSAGWNYGRTAVIANELDYLIILSQNTTLTDGMRDFIAALENDKPRYATWTQEGWHLIALSRELLELAGEFDTNFYPIYYEDTDYMLRMHLLGVLEECYETRVKALETPGGYSTTLGLRPAVPKCIEYFVKKWGVMFNYMDYQKQTFFSHPFDNTNNAVGYFPKRTTEQLIEEYGFADRKYDLYIKDVRNK